jgi:membrane dipeptidase
MAPEENIRWLPAIERYRQAGCSVASLNIGYGTMSLEEHVVLLDQMRAWISDHPHAYRLVDSVRDIEEARGAGLLAICFDIEGAAPFQDLTLVEAFYRRGVRWMSLAYNSNNQAAGGCHDEDAGLSGYGRELVAEMQRVGMVVCCSHVGYRTVSDVLACARFPVIFSHSNPRTLCDHPRNVPDELIAECARLGGVVGVNGLDLFLGGRATPQRICDHIDYLLEFIGPRHVALGLDHVFDLEAINLEKASMGATFPPGLGYEAPVDCFNIDDIPAIPAELLRRGHGADDVANVLEGNWMRIARTCWR